MKVSSSLKQLILCPHTHTHQSLHPCCSLHMHTRGKYIAKSLNSQIVGVGVVSDVHSIASGFGLHISVLSHVTIVTADIYPASHWIVTMDPGKLLVVGPNTPFMGSVNTGQLPALEGVSVVYCLKTMLTHRS